MLRSRAWMVWMLGVVALLAPATSQAQPRPDADGWTPLFNGKDLAGWVPMNVHPGTFSVRDGIIVSTGKPTGVMRTERMYENFEIELEWKHHVKGGNAGLFIWGDGITAPGTPFARGIEVQILDHGYVELHPSAKGKATGHGDVFPIHGATMVPDRPHPSKGSQRCLPSEERVKPLGEWNHYRVVCNDGVIKLSVNGKEVSGGRECNPRKGYICLESEGAECHFRNIRIKELPSTGATAEQTARVDPMYTFLYNGIDLAGWVQDEGHKGHWTPRDWTLDYDGKSEAKDKNLWTEKEYGDFEMVVDWRFTGKPVKTQRQVILPNGDVEKNADGSDKMVEVDDAGDSGIYLRGTSKAQVNMWCWPVGSGEVYGYRTDAKQPPEVRAGVTPKVKADNKIGSWNRFIITMRGDRLTVVLNGKTVIDNAQLPGVPAKGRIALQHHGDPIQFASVFIKELEPAKADGGGATETQRHRGQLDVRNPDGNLTVPGLHANPDAVPFKVGSSQEGVDQQIALCASVPPWRVPNAEEPPRSACEEADMLVPVLAPAQASPAIVSSGFIYEQAPFPSVHASTIAKGTDGLVAAFFGGTSEGNKDVCIWVSRHDGKNWLAPVKVAEGVERRRADGGPAVQRRNEEANPVATEGAALKGEERYPCWNPVLHAAPDGSLLLFYKVGPKPSNWWGMLTVSTDGGKTWGEPTRLPPNILGPVKNKAVTLPDGTLLCPSSTEDAGWRVHMEFTKDLGKTFTRTQALHDKSIGLIQPTVLFHDGKLIALSRSKGVGKIVAMESADGGKTWSEPTPTELPNPNSGIDGVTLKDGRSLLVYNHTAKGRSPLNVAVTKDGKTWTQAILLESEPGEYSYPAVIQADDGMVHITYTWKRQKVKHVVVDAGKIGHEGIGEKN